jgi:hypothetical protein
MAGSKAQNQRYYQNRNIRARNQGFTGYNAKRAMRARADDLGLDPDAPVSPDLEPAGLQGPFGPTPDPAWDFYWPTQTRNPDRKYSQFARYSSRYQRMEIVFRDGTPWHWDGFDPLGWDFFRRSRSTYDMIMAGGQDSPVRGIYGRGSWGGWGSIVGE